MPSLKYASIIKYDSISKPNVLVSEITGNHYLE